MTRHQPHHIAPSRQTVRVAHAYKNFQAHKGVSHIGLGVAALNTSRTLNSHGIHSEVWPTATPADIERQLAAAQDAAARRGEHPVSHVVISAPWVPTADLQGLLTRWPSVQFAVVSHSNVGFLMADPNGIKFFREGMDLAIGHHNFALAGNCAKFCHAWGAMYGRPVAHLPNLYDVSTMKPVGQRVPWHPGSPLRIGVFGATRPLKNLPSAVAACVELANELRADVEVWRNTGRTEGGGSVPDAIQQLTAGLRHCRVVDAGWASWPQFRSTVGRMNLLLSPSYTESFNMVTADGAAEGVASVVSDAIDWAPRDWVAKADDVDDIARVARRLIHDTHAVNEGQRALARYVAHGIDVWTTFLRTH